MVVSQFCSDAAVNNILNYSKSLVDSMNSGKYCSKELKEIQYLIFAGMVSYYGFEHIEDIHKAFRSANFIYTDSSFEEVLSKQQSGVDERLKNMINNGYVGAFVNYKISSDLFGRIHIGRDLYVVNNPTEAPDYFLEKIVHEVNHIVNAVNNTICLKNGKKVLRNGLFLMGIEDKNNYGEIIEESYNVLQSAEIMEHILEFSQYDIEDEEMRYALDKIKYAYGRKREGIGYEVSVPVFRELYNNPHFNLVVKKNRLSGDIKNVRLDIDSKIGEGGYNAFCDELDKMHYQRDVGYLYHHHYDKVKEYVKKMTV